MGRFNRRGTEQVFLVTSIPDPTAPVAATIAAGVGLHPVLRSLNGFTSEVADLDAADASSTWDKTIPGGESAANSSMTFYAGDDDADTEEDVRAAFVEGAERFIVFCPRGAPTAGEPADVFPVRIKANNDDKTFENAAATFTVQMSIHDEPSKQVAIV
jgi:hypothetical protein